MKNAFDRTFDAIISLVVIRDKRIVLFFDGEIQRCVFSFDQEKPRDVKLLDLVCQVADIKDGNLGKLDKKRFRLIASKNPDSNVYGIGHARKNLFFILNGDGNLMTEKEAYDILG